jgi:catechol 2,3-dioxygenase-like lactoylglutathione lyase family enzyme
MKLKLEGIILFVENVDMLKSFYVDVLKLDVVEETKSQWLLLKTGNCTIGLHKAGEQFFEAHQQPSKFENNAKIVFEIDEDIYKIREYLIAQRVAIQEVKTFEDYEYWICDGEDPEGNVFQIRMKK